METELTPPFLRWVGSKRWLVEKHAALLPRPADVQRLVLPFCGAGSIAFHYSDVSVRLLSDTNADLIAAFAAVRDEVEALVAELGAIEAAGWSKDHYLRILADFNAKRWRSPMQRAAWVFVIVFWGYNGLWRTNGAGEVNVAFGKPAKEGAIPRLHDPEHLRACSRALHGSTIGVMDFEEQVRLAEPRPGDFFYLDPPFVPASKTANFVGYGPRRFSSGAGAGESGQVELFGAQPAPLRSDQERLADQLPRLDAAGARWALSQSDTPEARRLFCEGRPTWNVVALTRSGAVSCDVEKRGAVGEILVRNYR